MNNVPRWIRIRSTLVHLCQMGLLLEPDQENLPQLGKSLAMSCLHRGRGSRCRPVAMGAPDHLQSFPPAAHQCPGEIPQPLSNPTSAASGSRSRHYQHYRRHRLAETHEVGRTREPKGRRENQKEDAGTIKKQDAGTLHDSRAGDRGSIFLAHIYGTPALVCGSPKFAGTERGTVGVNEDDVSPSKMVLGTFYIFSWRCS
jgi:hypothetical protein